MKQNDLKILIIGRGAREHAIVWKLSQGKSVKKIYAAPGNPGIARYAECLHIDVDKISELVTFAKQENVDLTVVMDIKALLTGIVDRFREENIPVLGASLSMVEMECSKIFAKELMRNQSIPTLPFHIFEREEGALEYCSKIGFPVVVKVEGLVEGRGVNICANVEELTHVLSRCMKEKIYGETGERVLIESYQNGEDISIPVLVDEETIIPLPSVRVYKNLHEEDKGPITSGMGGYCPPAKSLLRHMTSIERDIMIPTIHAIKQSDQHYHGLLQLNVRITEKGPRLMSCHVRPGEIETQCLLTRLNADLALLLLAVVNNELSHVNWSFSDKPSISIALVAEGYPDDPLTGYEVSGLDMVQGKAFIFQGDVKSLKGRLISYGGNILYVSLQGKDLASATEEVYRVMGNIECLKSSYRKDIGQK